MNYKIRFKKERALKNNLKILTFLISLISALLFSPIVFAEKNNLTILGTYNTAKLQIEFTGTANSFYGTETQTSSELGYGVLFEIPLGNKWSFESGAIYLPRGFKFPSSDFLSEGIDTYKWMNLFIPIEGRFNPTRLFTGFIGMYGSMAAGKINYTSYLNPGIQTSKTFQESGLKSFDYGLTYGAGLNVELNSNTEMLIEIRLNEGLANLADNTSLNIGTNTKVTMHEYSINLGFKL